MIGSLEEEGMLLTGHGHVGDALVGPASTDVAMIAREPDLLQIGDTLVGGRPLPDRRAERRSWLVHRQSLEGILDAVRQLGVVEPELRGRVVDAELFHPCDRGNPETTHGVKDRDGLDGDELAGATTFKDPRETLLNEQAPVVLRCVLPHGFVVKGDTWVRILVLLGLPILHVLEDGEEELHALAGQEAETSDHAGDAPSGEGATRKADENDLVAVNVVAANERIALAYVLDTVSAAAQRIGAPPGRILTSATPFPKAPPEKASAMVLPVPTPDW